MSERNPSQDPENSTSPAEASSSESPAAPEAVAPESSPESITPASSQTPEPHESPPEGKPPVSLPEIAAPVPSQPTPPDVTPEADNSGEAAQETAEETGHEAAQETAEETDDDHAQKPGFIRRWTKRIAVLLILLLIALRLALPSLASPAIAAGAKIVGLEASLDELELSLHEGIFGLKGLVVREPGSTEAVLTLGRCQLDLAMLGFLGGRLVIERIALDGLDVLIDRRSDGKLALLEIIAEALAKAPEDAAAAPPPSEPVPPAEPSDEPKESAGNGKIPALRAPIFIEAIQLDGIALRFRDRSMSPSFDTTLKVKVGITKLGLPTTEQPAKVAISLRCPPVFEELAINAELTLSDRDNSLAWQVEGRGFELKSLAPYIGPLHIESAGAPLRFGLRGSLKTHRSLVNNEAFDLELSLDGSHLTAGSVEQLALDRLFVKIPELGLRKISIERVELEGIRGCASRDAKARLHAAGLIVDIPALAAGPADKTEPSETPEPKAPAKPASAEESDEGQAGSEPFRLELGLLKVSAVALSYKDEALPEPVDLRLQLPELSLRDLIIDPDRSTAEAKLQVLAGIPGLIDEVKLGLQAQPFAPEKTLRMSLGVEGLHFDQKLGALLQRFGIESLHRRAKFGLELQARASLGKRIDAGLAISKLRFGDDSGELVALDALRVRDLSIDPKSLDIELGELAIVAPRMADIELDEQGRISAAGFRVDLKKLGAATKPKAAAEAKAVTPPAKPKPEPTGTEAAKPEGPRPRIRLARFHLSGVRAGFLDASMRPPSRLSLAEAAFGLEGLDIDLGAAPDAPVKTASWTALARLPGIIERIDVSGSLRPSPKSPAVTTKLRMTGLTGRAVAAYLAPLGVELLLKKGRLEIDAQAKAELGPGGALGASAALNSLEFADGRKLHLAIKDARIDGLAVEPREGGGLPKSVSISHLGLGTLTSSAALLKGGSLEAFGLRITPPKPKGSAASPAAAKPSKTKTGDEGEGDDDPQEAPQRKTKEPQLELPLLSLESFEVGRVAFEFTDRTRSPAVSFPILIKSRGGPFIVDTRENAKATPAALSAELQAPGIIESLRLDGVLEATLRSVKLKASVSGAGVTAKRIGPYLASAGISPELKDGRLGLTLAAKAELSTAGAIKAELDLAKIRFTDGAIEHAGLDLLAIRGLKASKAALSVEEIRLDRPRARLRRAADGALLAGGFRIAPPKVKTKPVPEPEDASQPKDATKQTEKPRTAPKQPEEKALAEQPAEAAPPPINLRRFRLVGATLDLGDAVPSKPVAVKLSTSLTLDNLALFQEAPPATLGVWIRAPGLLKLMTIRGPLRLDPKRIETRLQITGEGLKAGPIANYLPPHLTVTLKDGRFSALLQAALKIDPKKGIGALLAVEKVSLRDGKGSPPLVKLDALRIAASVSPKADRIRVKELKALGFATAAKRLADGSIEAPGILLSPAPAAPSVTANRSDESPAPELAAVKAPRKKKKRRKLSDMLKSRAKSSLPLIEIDELRLELERFRFVDEARKGTAPIALEGVVLRNQKPIRLLGRNPAAHGPIRLGVEASLKPLIRRIGVDLVLSPFSQEPALRAELSIEGIDGKGIQSQLPGLEKQLSLEKLVDGRFTSHLDAALRTGRSSPLDFDLSRGFGADIVVDKIHFREGKKGAVTLGVDEVHIDVARVEPANKRVRIRSIEVVNPRGAVFRDKAGVHLGSIVVKLPEAKAKRKAASKPTSKPAKSNETEPLKKPAEATPAPSNELAKAPDLPDISIDDFYLVGIDFKVDDRVVEPPFTLPLNGLDVHVSSISTKALVEKRPIPFEASVRAASVPLRKIPEDDLVIGAGALFGALKDLGDVVTGDETKIERELRPFWEEVRVAGVLSLSPHIEISVKTRLLEIELDGAEGLAAQAGIELTQGTFGLDLSARYSAVDGLWTALEIRLKKLEVAEGDNGPVRSWLKLPLPLQSVIFLLRDEDGLIKIPVTFSKPAEGLDIWALLDGIREAIGVIVARAVAAAPLRSLNAVGGLGKGVLSVVPGSSFLPFGGSGAKESRLGYVEFAPGDSSCFGSLPDDLKEMLALLRKDPTTSLTLRDVVGGGDLRRLRQRVAPRPDDCRVALARLATRRLELDRLRRRLQAQARSAYGTGLVAEGGRAAAAIRRVEQELGLLARSQRSLYSSMGKGAKRLADRRLRGAVKLLGRARCEAVRERMIRMGFPDARRRIRILRSRFEEKKDALGGRVVARIVKRKK